MSEPSPRPWRVVKERDPEGGNNGIVDADGKEVVGFYDDEGWLSRVNAELIVAAVNERERLRDELTRKAKNYEDVIAFHQRTEEYLRGLIKRLITVRETVFWRKDEKTGMTYETCLMDEEEARKTIEEAKAAVKEDKE